MKRLVLASASPRRRSLIRLLGLPWLLDQAEVSERFDCTASSLYAIAETLALKKARAVAARHADALILGADTIVILDETPYGKPSSTDSARRMLQALRGKVHEVITGVAFADTESRMTRVTSEKTVVTMRNYTEEEIDSYLASGDPMDKAGSYAIQNELFHPTERIAGCFTNVIGLPLCAVEQGLAEYSIRSKLSAGWKDQSQSLGKSRRSCVNCVALNLKLQVS
jgi:MAF protein